MEFTLERFPSGPEPPREPFSRIREVIRIVKMLRAETKRVGTAKVATEVGKGVLSATIEMILGEED